MNTSELRQKTSKELNVILQDRLREQFNFRMQKGSGQLTRPDKVKKVRRDIARIYTILHEIQSTQA